jgi:hypothetical protein
MSEMKNKVLSDVIEQFKGSRSSLEKLDLAQCVEMEGLLKGTLEALHTRKVREVTFIYDQLLFNISDQLLIRSYIIAILLHYCL